MEINSAIDIVVGNQSRSFEKKNEDKGAFSQLLTDDGTQSYETSSVNNRNSVDVSEASTEDELLQGQQLNELASVTDRTEQDGAPFQESELNLSSLSQPLASFDKSALVDSQETPHLMLSRAIGNLVFNNQPSQPENLVKDISSIKAQGFTMQLESLTLTNLLSGSQFNQKILNSMESLSLANQAANNFQVSTESSAKATVKVMLFGDKNMEKQNLVLTQSEEELTVFYRDYATEKTPKEIAELVANAFSDKQTRLTVYVNGHQFNLGD